MSDTTWHPTAFRSHTLAQVMGGEDLVGQNVTVCGFAEALRGKGKICFVDLRDGTGRVQVFLKLENMDEAEFEATLHATAENILDVPHT